jgi:hypothetical protein
MIKYYRYNLRKVGMEMSQSNKNVRKTLIIVLIALAVVLLVMYLLTLLLPRVLDTLSKNEEEEGTADFNFYEPDFNEDIYTDSQYLALIENGVLQYDNGSNSIVTLTLENAKDHGDVADMLTRFVYSIIEGDNDLYNSFFSNEYMKKHSPKGKFTMQKIYNGTIMPYSVETIQENNGNYTKFIYKLNYRILNNNGSFRMDIGDDSKTQYIVITDREGKLLIDAISTPHYK